MLKRASRLLLLLALLVSVPGCSKSRFVSMRLEPGQSLEFFVPLCGDDQLRSVQLESVADDDPSRQALLWSTTASGDEVATGRVEMPLDELEGVSPDEELLVSATTDDDAPVTSFTLSELPTDGSALKKGGGSDTAMSVTELQAAQQDDCSGSSFEDTALLVARVGVAALALGAIAWFVLYRRARRRREPALS